MAQHVKVLIGTAALCGRAIIAGTTGAGTTGADVAVVDRLRRELRHFKIRIDPQTAHDGYAAWRAGAHDDLVWAAADTAWYAGPLEATCARGAGDGNTEG